MRATTRTDYLTGTDAERQEQFAKFLKGMDWNTEAPSYSDLLTEDQRTQVEKRRSEKRQSVVLNATYGGDNENELATRDKNIGHLKEMQAEGMTYEDFAQLLRDHYFADGRMTPAESKGYNSKLLRLGELTGR